MHLPHTRARRHLPQNLVKGQTLTVTGNHRAIEAARDRNGSEVGELTTEFLSTSSANHFHFLSERLEAYLLFEAHVLFGPYLLWRLILLSLSFFVPSV